VLVDDDIIDLNGVVFHLESHVVNDVGVLLVDSTQLLEEYCHYNDAENIKYNYYNANDFFMYLISCKWEVNIVIRTSHNYY
jgi:hypothetical protein